MDQVREQLHMSIKNTWRAKIHSASQIQSRFTTITGAPGIGGEEELPFDRKHLFFQMDHYSLAMVHLIDLYLFYLFLTFKSLQTEQTWLGDKKEKYTDKKRRGKENQMRDTKLSAGSPAGERPQQQPR